MTTPAVHVRDLEVRLASRLILNNISFEVEAGAFVAIIGPNGAGKSTLLKALLGLIPLSTGAITLAGVPPHQTPAPWMGYVPQTKTLDRDFPALAVELVMTGVTPSWPWKRGRQGPASDTARKALARAGVEHLAERPAAQLSGGELQRVYLARAFARNPRYLLLDEPAAGLDVAGEADMYHIIESYQRIQPETTVLMITHDWDGARLHASQVLLLNRTNIGFGPPASVLNDQTLLQVFGHTGHTHPKSEAARHA